MNHRIALCEVDRIMHSTALQYIETPCKTNIKTKLISGNEALALGALQAGVTVVTGYPGTPSSEVIGSLLNMDLEGRHIEWSTNEKVAFEIATGASWAGQRALCTMKMSGLNVAFDSVISIAYSGVNGGLVIYVADDPGVSAGMAEQDSRGYALMADLPMLEPCSVFEAYELTPVAFELSERAKTPVFLRMVTSVANSHCPIPVEPIALPQGKGVLPERELARYTKASPAICIGQHRDVITRLEKVGEYIIEMGLNTLACASDALGENRSGTLVKLGIIAAGVIRSYLDEAFEVAGATGFNRNDADVLSVKALNPFPTREVRKMLKQCEKILVLEELEPYLEQKVYVEAQKMGYTGIIFGKLNGIFSRIGEYHMRHVVQGICSALDLAIPDDLLQGPRPPPDIPLQGPLVCVRGARTGAHLWPSTRP